MSRLKDRQKTRYRCAAAVVIAVAIAGALSIVSVGATTPIAPIDLGTLGGASSSAKGLNDTGMVIGYSEIPAGGFHIFAWTESTGMVDIGSLGGTSTDLSVATFTRTANHALNDSGVVVGYSETADGYVHAFRWTLGEGMTDLGTLGGDSSRSVAVNANGMIVGQSSTTHDAYNHAFAWTPKGGMVDLGTLDGNTVATAVNIHGMVVGRSGSRAFVWTKSTGMVDIGTLEEDSAAAEFVTDSGLVVGSIRTAAGHGRAFVWSSSSGTVDIGTLGGSTVRLIDVNANGVAVGLGSLPNGEAHAFVWTAERGIVDLGPIIVRAINDYGVILGGDDSGFFTLTPTGVRTDLGGPGLPIVMNNTGYAAGDGRPPDEPYYAALWPPPRPQTIADCQKGGWLTFGFKNQGLCIQFVNKPSKK